MFSRRFNPRLSFFIFLFFPALGFYFCSSGFDLLASLCWNADMKVEIGAVANRWDYTRLLRHRHMFEFLFLMGCCASSAALYYSDALTHACT